MEIEREKRKFLRRFLLATKKKLFHLRHPGLSDVTVSTCGPLSLSLSLYLSPFPPYLFRYFSLTPMTYLYLSLSLSEAPLSLFPHSFFFLLYHFPVFLSLLIVSYFLWLIGHGASLFVLVRQRARFLEGRRFLS